MSTILEVVNVRVDYGRFTALSGFNLALEQGHLLGLIGPNGAGKTTALRACAGLQPPTTGEVRLLGEQVEPGNVAALSQIGFTPDVPALYPALTVGEFLEFVGRSFGLERSTIEERTDFWLEQVWLGEKRGERIGTLSRGMLQRLAVARALMPNPALVLLDEPAAGLDPAGRVQFRRLLASLRDQGKALIVSSHILADLHEYCTHIAIMEHGRVRTHGTVAEVVSALRDRRCRYRITLAAPVADLAARLAEIPHASDVRVNDGYFTFEYERDAGAAAGLLRRLIESGVPVATFSPVASELEEAYLQAGIRQVD